MQNEHDISKLQNLVRVLPKFDGFGNGIQCDPHELLIKVLESKNVNRACFEGKYIRSFACSICKSKHSITETYNILSVVPHISVEESIIRDCGYIDNNTDKTTVNALCEQCNINTLQYVRSKIEAGICLVVHFKTPSSFEPELTVGMYKLCAICYYHSINNRMGHYTAKCLRKNNWLYFDDTQVSTTCSVIGLPVMAFYM